ncbi:MAG: ZIP family metal transporter [Eubacterium sp.]|nr:ZIP family metal transporter [Eubacterium sp.]
MDWFSTIHPVYQGLLATIFTYGITMLGASLVFFFKNINQKLLDVMMGFAAGVMIAASFWSLLNPAIILAEKLGKNAAVTASVGFILGSLFIMASDIMLQNKKQFMKEDKDSAKENTKGFKRCVLLTTAVTMHNIPEGMAVGVAFGCVALQQSDATLMGAVMLALGIGIQNFPEGTCVAMPLRREGVSRLKSFFIGQASGIVEPIAGVLGVVFALKAQAILPVVLSFSAGAMISVVCSELIPESFLDNKQLASIGVSVGFTVMMFLDVILG